MTLLNMVRLGIKGLQLGFSTVWSMALTVSKTVLHSFWLFIVSLLLSVSVLESESVSAMVCSTELSLASSLQSSSGVQNDLVSVLISGVTAEAIGGEAAAEEAEAEAEVAFFFVCVF